MRVSEQSTKLGSSELNTYLERGYHFPIRVLDDSEVGEFRKHFENYRDYYSDRLNSLPPSKHGSIYAHTHMFLG